MTNRQVLEPSGSKPDPAAVGLFLLAVAIFSVALYWLSWSSVIWFRYHPHLPWRDLFLVLRDIINLQQNPLSLSALETLLAPHYEAHRIVLPRLLLWADLSWMGGQLHGLYLSGLLSMLLLWTLYVRMAADFLTDFPALLASGALALVWLASPAHMWNMLNGINTAWHLTLAMAGAGLYAILSTREKPGWGRWGTALLLCVLASFATFGGVIAVLLLPIVALLLHRQALIPISLLSLAFVWWYTGDLNSDASIASSWTGGPPEVVELIRERARDALSNHSIETVTLKTLEYLAWPLSNERTIWSRWLVVGSLVLLASSWLHVLRCYLWRGTGQHPWLLFCLFGATLAVGIAIATQLGRVIEQPAHAHGPSQERYQTIVVFYWMCWTGVIQVSAERLSDGGRLITTACLLILALTMTVPMGTYLEEEIDSSGSAAALFAKGESMVSRNRTPLPGTRFTPEYVFSFDQYFGENNLAYHRRLGITPGVEYPDCRPGVLRMNISRADPQAISVSVHPTIIDIWTLRDIVMVREYGPTQRLVPVHNGDYSPQSLVSTAHNVWEGSIAAYVAPGGDWLLEIRRLYGTERCRLDMESL